MAQLRRAARQSLLSSLLPALLSAAAAHAEPAVYRLDPEHSFVHFEVRHFGTSTTRGRVGSLQAEVMLDRAAGRGGYALGTGNSVPAYVPDDRYFAMIRAALDRR